MSYIARPTELLKEYLSTVHELKPRREFNLGRLSMALEIITIIKTLEDELVPMLALQRAEHISILTTILTDQGIADQAMDWYEALSRWRLPVFVPDGAEPADIDGVLLRLERLASDPSSPVAGLGSAVALAERTRALPDTGQSLALPSGESAEEPASEDEATPSESDEAPDETDELLAEHLQELRNRHGTQP